MNWSVFWSQVYVAAKPLIVIVLGALFYIALRYIGELKSKAESEASGIEDANIRAIVDKAISIIDTAVVTAVNSLYSQIINSINPPASNNAGEVTTLTDEDKLKSSVKSIDNTLVLNKVKSIVSDDILNTAKYYYSDIESYIDTRINDTKLILIKGESITATISNT